MRNQVVGLALLGILIGCTPTIAQQQDRFKGELSSNVGKELHASLYGKIQATEIKTLPSGKSEYTYKDFWRLYRVNRERCDVVVEVDPQSKRVLAASSEGPGCHMPY